MKNRIVQFFQPLLNSFKKENEILKKSLDYSAGIEFVHENPDRLLRDINKNIRLYDAMLLDDRIKMVIDLKKRMTLSTPYNVVSASEDERDEEIAAEVRNQLCLKQQSGYKHIAGYDFESMLDNALDAIVYGYKVCEKVWTQQGDKIVFTGAKFKHSMFFDFGYDDYGNINELLIGKDYGSTVSVKDAEIDDKFIIWTYPYTKDGNWYGDSDLKEVYTQYRSKLHIQKQRNIFLEKWGSPIPEVIYDSAKTTPAEKSTLEDILNNFQEGTYLMNPGVYDVNSGELRGKFKFILHEARGGSNTDQFEKAIDQIDKQITRSMLIPDKIGYSESPGGSYNMSEHQLDILIMVIENLHHWLEKNLNKLVRQIVDYNFDKVENYPVFTFEKLSDNIRAEMLEKLINLGVVDKREKWIRSRVGVPEISAEEREEIEQQKAEARPPMMPPIPGNPIQPFKSVTFKAAGNPFNSEKVKKYFDTTEDSMVAEYISIMKNGAEEMIKQIQRKKIIENNDLKAKHTLVFPAKSELKNFLANKFSEIYFNAKIDAINEVKPRLKKRKVNFKRNDSNIGMTSIDGGKLLHSHEYAIDDTGSGQTTGTNGEGNPHVHEIMNFVCSPEANDGHTHNIERQANLKDDLNWLDREYIERLLEKYGEFGTLTKKDLEAIKLIKDRAFTITGIESDKVLKDVLLTIDTGIRSGMVGSAIVNQVRDKLSMTAKQNALTIVRTAIADNYNTSRMNFFTSPAMAPVIEAYQYQAVMDDDTTDFCREHDGQIISASDPKLAQITPPNHFNCRSILVPIFTGEGEEDGYFKDYDEKFDEFGTNVKHVSPDPGFGGAV